MSRSRITLLDASGRLLLFALMILPFAGNGHHLVRQVVISSRQTANTRSVVAWFTEGVETSKCSREMTGTCHCCVLHSLSGLELPSVCKQKICQG